METGKKDHYDIMVCTGTSCYFKGSTEILRQIRETLAIGPSETTADGRFSLLLSSCVGACEMPPVMTIGEDVYVRFNPRDVPDILNKYTEDED